MRDIQGLPHDKNSVILFDRQFDVCACCEKAKTDEGITIRRYIRCKAIAYCGRECQAKYWNMGHKGDCKRVPDVEENHESFEYR